MPNTNGDSSIHITTKTNTLSTVLNRQPRRSRVFKWQSPILGNVWQSLINKQSIQ